jgi:hypothetical protein
VIRGYWRREGGGKGEDGII